MEMNLTDWQVAADASYSNLMTFEDAAQALEPFALWIQCLSTGQEQPATRVMNLRACTWIHKPFAGYLSLIPGQTGREAVELGLSGIPEDLQDMLKIVALDLETPPIQYTDVLQAVYELRMRGKTPLIYTSKEIYQNQMQFQSHPDNCPLWLAHWEVSPVDALLDLPFSGWQKQDVVAIQYRGNTQIGNIEVDFDEIDPAFWLPGATPNPPSPPDPYAPLEDAITEMYSLLDRARVALSRLKPPVGG